MFEPSCGQGGTPLSDAVREGHSGVVRMLVEGRANLGFSETETASQVCELAHVGDPALQLPVKGTGGNRTPRRLLR